MGKLQFSKQNTKKQRKIKQIDKIIGKTKIVGFSIEHYMDVQKGTSLFALLLYFWSSEKVGKKRETQVPGSEK